MSSIDKALTHSVPIPSSVEPPESTCKAPIATAGSENGKSAEHSLAMAIGDTDPDVILVDYEENDPENPLNWSPMQKWLIVFAISWMGFVR